MSFAQLLQAMSFMPQIIENLKKMRPEEREHFVNQLGLEGQEKEMAVKIITRFQEGKSLSPEEQQGAHKLLEKALQMNNIDMASLMNLGFKK